MIIADVMSHYGPNYPAIILVGITLVVIVALSWPRDKKPRH